MNRRDISILLFGVLLLFIGYGVIGCGGGGGSSSNTNGSNGNPPPSQSGNVSIPVANSASAPMGFAFSSPVNVKSGSTVVWSNQSSSPHAIVWDSVSPSSSPAPGANIGTFQAGTNSSAWIAPTVTTSTTYNYHCGIHGPTMSGMIIVTP